MRYCRTTLLLTFAISLLAADPKFEAASVKPTDRCTMQNSINPGRIALNGTPLIVALMEAFRVKMDQISGPSWLETDCFEIIAKMPDGATKDQLPAMLQALLAERFKLAAHKETRQRPGYALLVDKNGPKLKASDPNDPATQARAGQVAFGRGGAAGLKGSMTLAVFSRLISRRLDGPVQDLTGIEGTYDIDVSWAPDAAFEKIGRLEPSVEAGASLPAGKGNIFNEIRDSLGLKLESRKQQVEFVVIDSIARVPTEN